MKIFLLLVIYTSAYQHCVATQIQDPPSFWPTEYGDPFQAFKPTYDIHDDNYRMLMIASAFGSPNLTDTMEHIRVYVEDLLPTLGGTFQFPGRITEILIPSPNSTYNIPVTVYTPTHLPVVPAIVIFFHRGGIVVGSRASDDTIVKKISHDSGAIFLSVEYRLLPDNEAPTAPIDDAFTVACWLLGSTCHKEQVGGHVDSKVGVAGVSSGGQLAALVANDIADVDFQIMVNPYLDLSRNYSSFTEFEMIPGLLPKTTLDWMHENSFAFVPDYLTSPHINPMADPDVSASPPALIVVAEMDALRDGALAYANKLLDAGVQVQLLLVRGVVHDFLSNTAAYVTASKEAVDQVVEFIRPFHQDPSSFTYYPLCGSTLIKEPPPFWPAELNDPFHTFKPKYCVHQENYAMLMKVFPYGITSLAELGSTTEVPFSFNGKRTHITIPSPHDINGIPIMVYTPNDLPDIPAIVIFYHGELVIGSQTSPAENVVEIVSSESGAIFLSVEYGRLPDAEASLASIDDALTVARWLLGSTCHKELVGGHRDSKVGVAGESSGGQLAALTANNVTGLDFQILVNPYLDISRTQPSFEEFELIPGLLPKSTLDELYSRTFAHIPGALTSPLINPMAAPDVSAAPPALVILAEMDALRDAGLEYAHKLDQAGVQVKEVMVRGVVFGFFHMGGVFSTKYREAVDPVVEFIQMYHQWHSVLAGC